MTADTQQNPRGSGGRVRLATAAANVAPRGRPRGCVAADEQRGGGVDAAAGRPRRSAPRGGDVAAAAAGRPRDQRPAWMAAGVCRHGRVARRGGGGGGPPPRRSAPRVNGRGGTSLTFETTLIPPVKASPLPTPAARDGTKSCSWLWTGSSCRFSAVRRRPGRVAGAAFV